MKRQGNMRAAAGPYNPLDKQNLGASVCNAMLESPIQKLPPEERFPGAGIYAIYYTGDHPLYRSISARNAQNQWNAPIYVGKAIPAGGRKGSQKVALTMALHSRLQEHADSIRQTSTLSLDDFACRYLIVDDIWIPLGESLLIQAFEPVWNIALDGFGNHDPGSGRRNQKRSPWDLIHPGRVWARKLRAAKKSFKNTWREVGSFIHRTTGDEPPPEYDHDTGE